MALHLWNDRIRACFSRQAGQTMPEYAVVLGVITPAIVVAIALLTEPIIEVIMRVVGFLG